MNMISVIPVSPALRRLRVPPPAPRPPQLIPRVFQLEDTTKKAHEQAVERIKNLEEELDRSRKEAISLRLERDKFLLELNFPREKLDSFMKEFEHQREEMNGVLARNVKFSQLIIEYQRKVRESSESVHVAEELSRKSTMEVSLLKHEKELALNSEKRACDEVCSLSERVHRLQATTDTIHSTEEVREESRILEKKRQEEYLKQVERDWAQVKKELQEERDSVRSVTRDREHTLQNAMKQVEELGTQLADSLRAVASAESRAAVAEARCSNIEATLKASRDKGVDGENGLSTYLTTEVTMDLPKVKEEMEKLKEEARANKDHMLQYKNIAQVNEVALKQVEAAHERFKAEAYKMKKSLEAEILTLRGSVCELENDSKAKSIEFATAVSGKEEALGFALAEIDSLKNGSSVRGSQILEIEVKISSLKEDLEKEHQRWLVAQNNYERQVILQSDTIQELTRTSQALGSLQEELSKLQKLSETLKSENAILKETLASEKSVLGKLKDDAERKYNEVNEQVHRGRKLQFRMTKRVRWSRKKLKQETDQGLVLRTAERAVTLANLVLKLRSSSVEVVWVVAALGGVLIGYYLVVSGTLFQCDYFLFEFFPRAYYLKLRVGFSFYCKPFSWILQVISSGWYIVAIVSSWFTAPACRMLGWRAVLRTFLSVLTVAAGVNIFCSSLPMVLIGRIIDSFAVGILFQVIPKYITDISAADQNEHVELCFHVCLYVGVVLGNVITYFAACIGHWGWHLFWTVEAVLGSALLASSYYIRDSPRSMLERDRIDDATATVIALRGSRAAVQEIVEVQEARRESQTHTDDGIWVKYKQRLLISLANPVFNSLNGAVAGSAFLPRIFSVLGFTQLGGVVSAAVTSSISIASILLSVFLVDRVGRRRMILSSFLIAFLTLVLIIPTLLIGEDSVVGLSREPSLFLIALLCFLALASGVSSTPKGWISEGLPAHMTWLGPVSSSSTSWFLTFLLVQGISLAPCYLKAWIFVIFSAFASLFYGVLYFTLPETTDLDPAEIDDALKNFKLWRIRLRRGDV